MLLPPDAAFASKSLYKQRKGGEHQKKNQRYSKYRSSTSRYQNLLTLHHSNPLQIQVDVDGWDYPGKPPKVQALVLTHLFQEVWEIHCISTKNIMISKPSKIYKVRLNSWHISTCTCTHLNICFWRPIKAEAAAKLLLAPTVSPRVPEMSLPIK